MENPSGASSHPNPGAMSLLDKYASINTNIEDTRRRVIDVRSNLEQCNKKIDRLVEERNGMDVETKHAIDDKSRLLAELEEVKKLHQRKVFERDCARRDNQLAKSEHETICRFVKDERKNFVERCREFRESCKRLRVASSMFVLEDEEILNEHEVTKKNEKDLWRRLQGENPSKEDTNDLEVELAEKDDTDIRREFMVSEAALNSERTKHDEAIQRSNAQNQRLTQQRAQLQRHRKEVEELERDINTMKGNIIEENQLAHTFEKECARQKQIRSPKNNVIGALHKTNNDFHTPTNVQSFGNPVNRATGEVVMNPYRQTNRTLSSCSLHNGPKNNSSHSCKERITTRSCDSNKVHGITPDNRRGERSGKEMTTHHHPHRGGYVRNQRQFGTSVGVSLGMDATPKPPLNSSMTTIAQAEDNTSDISSTSSGEDIMTFNIFGQK